MSPNKKKRAFTFFIGIDISKDKLDFAVIHEKNKIIHTEISNTAQCIDSFLHELITNKSLKLSRILFCMEETGFYKNHLIAILLKRKALFVIENPVKVVNSLGLLRGKDDKTDAIRLAKYAQKNFDELKLWEPKRPILTQLMMLASLRDRIKTVGNILKVPIKEQKKFVNRSIQEQTSVLCAKSIAAAKIDELNIDKAIRNLVDSDPKISHLVKLITSVPCVGVITAIQIIITTNEFIDINDGRKFACYAGVAPFKRESGILTGRARVSRVANRKVKTLLHICAMGSLRIKSELRDYYDRKTQIEGKPKMAVLNAIRNKLILRIFACVKQDRPFINYYKKDNDEVITTKCEFIRTNMHEEA